MLAEAELAARQRTGDHGLDLDVVLEGGLAPEHLLRGLDTDTLGLVSP